MKQEIIIETDRIIIRTIKREDAEPIFKKISSQLSVVRYLGYKIHTRLSETKKCVRLSIKENKQEYFYGLVIVKKDSGEVIGTIDLQLYGHKCTLSYALSQDEQGKGYMSEALPQIINWIVKTLKSVRRIQAVVHVENEKSSVLLKKIDMEEEGILRRWMTFPNVSEHPENVFSYSYVF